MISIDDYLTSSGKHLDVPTRSPPNPAMMSDAKELLRRVNALLGDFGEERCCTNGYRDATLNGAVGGAKGSKHKRCTAIDVEDEDRRLWHWCAAHVDKLIQNKLWMEDPEFDDDGHVHFQSEPPPSGNRIFIPR